MLETEPKKMVRRSFASELGIICILLIALIAYFSISTISAQNSYNNLKNQNNQLQAWLDGNETLLNQTQTWLDNNITYYNSQILDLQNMLNVSSAGELLILKITDTSDWTGFACLNGSISAMPLPLNSPVEYGITTSSYNEYPILSVKSTNLSETVVSCLVGVNPNYVYSLGKGDFGWATYEFYSVNYQSGSMQIGSEILSLQATSVAAGGHATDGTLFMFPN